MKNKKIILIAALAFAGWTYLRSKSGKSSFTDGSGDSGGSGKNTSGVNINSVDSILENLDFTQEERSFVKNVQMRIKNSTLWSESVRNKATQKGNTLAKQVVIDALWLLYSGKDSDGNIYWKNARGWQMTMMVKDLY